MSGDTSISVLLIEDSPTDVLLVQAAFATVSSARFAVTHTVRLSEGLQHLQQGQFSVVLLDLGLPDSQGMATLTTLCRQAPETPVVVLTALTDETLAIQSVQAGAQDYLLKGEITGPLLGRTLRYAIERKRVEVIQARLAAIVDNSTDAIIGKTLKGVIMSWNAGAEQMYGYTAAEVVGRSMAFLMPPETSEDMPHILARLQRGEHIAAYETVRVRKDGVRLDVSLTVSPIRNDVGQMVGAAAIARDITPRKRAEKALQQQRDWFNVTLSSIGEGVIATDTKGHTTFINAVATELIGCQAEGALGRPITEVFRIVQAQTQQPVDNSLLHALQEDRVVRLTQETLLLTGDAGMVPIAVSASPMRTEDGELLGAVLVCRDMSVQRQMEEDLL
jgi:PAS domain S-box-containing protein